ncbi:hypothetical protein CRUP_011954 [Coryphaenoides rupestris]|nr:hypothetical protein CRUP_011954 [Coryphaenoides rupestris]
MDVLEPHYLESWTKDTESTWLASTDTDLPLLSEEAEPETPPSAPIRPTQDPVGPPRMLPSSPGNTAQSVPHTEEMNSVTVIQSPNVSKPSASTKWPKNNRMSTQQAVTTQQSSRQQADIKRGSKMVETREETTMTTTTTTTQAATGKACQQYGAEEEEEEEEEEQREPASAVR